MEGVMDSEERKTLDIQIESFKGSFCPYGYLDIENAVSHALGAGYDGLWAFEQIHAFSGECGVKYPDIDPCVVVMDAILQEARCEIEQLCGFDIQNDAGFDVYGNFMASSWKYNEEDLRLLNEVLAAHCDELQELSEVTLYFLAEVEIDIEQIRAQSGG